MTKRDDGSNTFRYPKYFVFLGVLTCALTGIFGPIAFIQSFNEKQYFDMRTIPLYLCVILIHLLGWIVISLHVLWKVELLDDHFIYTNLLGIKRSYQYCDITLITLEYSGCSPGKYVVYVGKKRVFGIEYLAVNFKDFPRKLRANIRKNGGVWNCVPINSKRK